MAFFQTANVWVQELADGICAIVLDGPEQANWAGPDWVNDLIAALEKVENEARFRIAVLRSARQGHFCDGIDPAWLATASNEEIFALCEACQTLTRRLSSTRLMTVAVVAGICQGVGLQVATACDWRVAVIGPATRFALPEVQLGLVPFCGGTIRLPRLIGFEEASKLILTGKKLDAKEAHAVGLVDELATQDDQSPPALFDDVQKRNPMRPSRRSLRRWLLESNVFGRRLLHRGVKTILERKLPEGFSAPWEALHLMYLGLADGALDLGYQREREALTRLLDASTFRHLLAFNARREEIRQKGNAISRSVVPKSAGIVGVGGKGLALLLQMVTRGCQVVVQAENETDLGAGLLRIYSMFKQETVRGALTPQQAQAQLSLIRGTTVWKHFDDVEIVFDTRDQTAVAARGAMEKIDAITAKSVPIVMHGAVPAVGAVHDWLKHPRRVAWVYWHEPMVRMSLVEMVHSPRLEPSIYRRLRDFFHLIGKTVVSVPESVGLLVPRVFLPMFNEAGILLSQGILPERIDEAMIRFGFTDGPLVMMDRFGIDVVADLIEAIKNKFEGRLEFEPGFRKMADSGLKGASTGVGFVLRDLRKKTKYHRPAAEFFRPNAGKGITPLPTLAPKDQYRLIQRRLANLAAAEALRLAWERPETPADELDFALVSAGWPVHLGGPLEWIRQQGAEKFFAECESLAASEGKRFFIEQKPIPQGGAAPTPEPTPPPDVE